MMTSADLPIELNKDDTKRKSREKYDDPSLRKKKEKKKLCLRPCIRGSIRSSVRPSENPRLGKVWRNNVPAWFMIFRGSYFVL